MAINLLGKADSTLVTAATRAGMAGAPADYSRTFESVSRNYQYVYDLQSWSSRRQLE